MSGATESPLRTPDDATADESSDAVAGELLASVRAAAFWAAVLLPIATIFLITTGTAVVSTAVLGLVGANAVCAVIGHDHAP